MTSNEMQELVGRTGYVSVKEWQHIQVEILNVRQVWGKVQVLVKPLGMEATKWFELDSIELNKSTKETKTHEQLAIEYLDHADNGQQLEVRAGALGFASELDRLSRAGVELDKWAIENKIDL